MKGFPSLPNDTVEDAGIISLLTFISPSEPSSLKNSDWEPPLLAVNTTSLSWIVFASVIFSLLSSEMVNSFPSAPTVN